MAKFTSFDQVGGSKFANDQVVIDVLDLGASGYWLRVQRMSKSGKVLASSLAFAPEVLQSGIEFADITSDDGTVLSEMETANGRFGIIRDNKKENVDIFYSPAADGGGGAASNDFIFTHSGADEDNNIFTSWENLITAMGDVSGAKRLYIKPTSGNQLTTTETTAMDFTDVEIIGYGNSAPDLTFANGCTFVNNGFPKKLDNVSLFFQNSAVIVCTFDNTESNQITLVNGANISNVGSSAAINSTNASFKMTMNFYDKSSFVNEGTETINAAHASSQINMNLFDGSFLDDDSITGGGTLNVIMWPGSNVYSGGHSGYSGTVNVRIKHNTVVPMSTSRRDTLIGLTNGLVIYNTSLGKLQGRESAAWANLI